MTAHGRPSLVLGALLAPAPALAQPVTPDSWNAPLVATGAVVFAATYGGSVIAAGSSDLSSAARLYVPVVGPWLALDGAGDCPMTSPMCGPNMRSDVLLVADGVFQAAGIATMIDGLLESSHRRASARTADRGVHVTPSYNGVVVFGRF